MRLRAVGVVALTLFIAFPVVAGADEWSAIGQENESTGGPVIGFGAGYWMYYTSWKTPYKYNYYTKTGFHHLDRIVFTGFLETPTLFDVQPFTLRGRGELNFGIIGGTKDELSSSEETISSGGITAGFALLGKVAMPLELSPPMTIAPYLASGFQFVVFNSNGKEVNETFENMSYQDGWDEFLILLPLSLGADVDFGQFILGMDLRFVVLGAGFTDWEPKGREIDNQKVTGTMINGYVGFEL